MSESDGWTYTGGPTSGDARRIVTLRQDGMVWVGIRAYHAGEKRWMNNNEPERAEIVAWRDLYEPAKGFWDRGKLVVPPSCNLTLRTDEATMKAIQEDKEQAAVRALNSAKIVLR